VYVQVLLLCSRTGSQSLVLAAAGTHKQTDPQTTTRTAWRRWKQYPFARSRPYSGIISIMMMMMMTTTMMVYTGWTVTRQTVHSHSVWLVTARLTAGTSTLPSATPDSITFSPVLDPAFLPTAFDTLTDASVSCVDLYDVIWCDGVWFAHTKNQTGSLPHLSFSNGETKS